MVVRWKHTLLYYLILNPVLFTSRSIDNDDGGGDDNDGGGDDTYPSHILEVHSIFIPIWIFTPC